MCGHAALGVSSVVWTLHTFQRSFVVGIPDYSSPYAAYGEGAHGTTNAVSRSPARKDFDGYCVRSNTLETLWPVFWRRCSLQAVMVSPRDVFQEVCQRKRKSDSTGGILFVMCSHHLLACTCAGQEYVERLSLLRLLLWLFQDK